jgi:hypothetical protein
VARDSNDGKEKPVKNLAYETASERAHELRLHQATLFGRKGCRVPERIEGGLQRLWDEAYKRFRGGA